MKYTIHIGENPIVLEHDDIDDVINVDALTTIDTGNLYGEMVTVTPVTNRIGLMKAEVEKLVAEAKLDLRIFESRFKNNLRKDAALNHGSFNTRVGNDDVKIKLTEKSLESAMDSDDKWIKKKRNLISREGQLGQMEALYWACQDKSRKVKSLVDGTTPQEFIKNLVEGTLHGITIKKN